MHMDTYTYNLL